MRAACATFALLLAAGCATQPAPVPPVDPALRACVDLYEDMDARVDAARVRDAQDARIPGYPYLRANRLLASYRQMAAADNAALAALVEHMRALDLDARKFELENLPQPGTAEKELEGAKACSRELTRADLADPERRAALLAAIAVPDDYSSASRVLGLYLLAQAPFSEGVRRYQADVRAAYAAELHVPPGARLERYAPPQARPVARAEVARMLRDAVAANPLGIPELAPQALEALYAAYAPVFEFAVSGEYDRIGALGWSTGASAPGIQAGSPVVYRQAAWTRVQGRTLLQLVYTAWFSERPAESSGDILAGKLDGVVWRVTLGADGEPVVYDSMHPCGCYHMFYPTPRARPVDAPAGEIEWMFSPQALPRIAEGERVVVRVASRTHYVERIFVARQPGDAPVYRFAEYDELRALRLPGGGSASAFGPDGLIAGSERTERFLFWPMGIASAGAMRQWGRHATAFVGRRHFDDADLIERRFRVLEP